MLAAIGRFEEAIQEARQATEIDPNYPSSYIYLAFIYQAKGQFKQAIKYLEKSVSIFPHPFRIANLGMIYGAAGRQADAARILEELTELSRRAYVSPLAFATIHQGMGDVENWRKTMQASFEERSGLLAYLKSAPWHDPMRSDPFFQELVGKVGLP